MTDDEILNFIHAASFGSDWHYYINGEKKVSKAKMEALRRFAKLVIDKERNKCSRDLLNFLEARRKK